MVAGLTNDFDGAWYAVFGAQLGGEGIVLLRNGFILGCDDQYFYEGRYVLDDDGGLQGASQGVALCRRSSGKHLWRVRAICDSGKLPS